MSTALDFTRDINDLPPMNQRPLKAKNGMLVTPQRVKSDKMLSEAPPENIITTPNPVLEREPVVKPFDMMMMEPQYPVERNIEPEKPMMNPQLQMILQAQNDQTGPMILLQTKNEPESGLARLIENLPKEYII